MEFLNYLTNISRIHLVDIDKVPLIFLCVRSFSGVRTVRGPGGTVTDEDYEDHKTEGYIYLIDIKGYIMHVAL